MPKAIQRIVEGYVRLNDRQALENPTSHRQRLCDLQSKSGAWDFGKPIGELEDEIAEIAAGLKMIEATEPNS